MWLLYSPNPTASSLPGIPSVEGWWCGCRKDWGALAALHQRKPGGGWTWWHFVPGWRFQSLELISEHWLSGLWCHSHLYTAVMESVTNAIISHHAFVYLDIMIMYPEHYINQRDDLINHKYPPSLRIQASAGNLEGNTRSPFLWQLTSDFSGPDFLEHLQTSGQISATAWTIHSITTINHTKYCISTAEWVLRERQRDWESDSFDTEKVLQLFWFEILSLIIFSSIIKYFKKY